MATNGVLGKVKTIANLNQIVYTVPAKTVSTATISALNTGSANATIRIFITTTPEAPDIGDAIEYGAVITPGGVIERSCMPVGAGESIIIHSTVTGVSIRVAGFEAVAP